MRGGGVRSRRETLKRAAEGIWEYSASNTYRPTTSRKHGTVYSTRVPAVITQLAIANGVPPFEVGYRTVMSNC